MVFEVEGVDVTAYEPSKQFRSVVRGLWLGDRVEVWCGRAERLGRDAHRRGAFDAVVSRGFGAPAITAECAAPFLRVGGQLVVSEPVFHENPNPSPIGGLPGKSG